MEHPLPQGSQGADVRVVPPLPISTQCVGASGGVVPPLPIGPQGAGGGVVPRLPIGAQGAGGGVVPRLPIGAQGAGSRVVPPLPIIAQGVPVQSKPSILTPRTSALRTMKSVSTPDGKRTEEWRPNSKWCERCGTRFTLITRRHHCRACGCCVCSRCSPFRMQLDNPVTKHNLSRSSATSFTAESFGEANALGAPLQAHRVCSTCHLGDRLVDGSDSTTDVFQAPWSAR